MTACSSCNTVASRIEKSRTRSLPKISTKILPLTLDRLTDKDSLCFLLFPLANFPATFGINKLCKGFFLRKFNTLENQDYKGPMPDPIYYDPEGMSVKKKADFERW